MMFNTSPVAAYVTESESRPSFRQYHGRECILVKYHDKNGSISISSSFGNYSYVWKLGGDLNLRQFFSAEDPDALADAFFRNFEKHSFECREALKEVRAHAISERRCGSIPKDQAREVFNALTKLEETHGLHLKQNAFIGRFLEFEALRRFNSDPQQSEYGQRLSESFLVLRDEAIPLIQEQFKMSLRENPQTLASNSPAYLFVIS